MQTCLWIVATAKSWLPHLHGPVWLHIPWQHNRSEGQLVVCPGPCMAISFANRRITWSGFRVRIRPLDSWRRLNDRLFWKGYLFTFPLSGGGNKNNLGPTSVANLRIWHSSGFEIGWLHRKQPQWRPGIRRIRYNHTPICSICHIIILYLFYYLNEVN